MSDTPRTDAARWDDNDPYEAMAHECSKMERELTAARAEIERLRGEIEQAYLEGCIDGHNAAHPESNGKDKWEYSRAKRISEGKE